MWIDKRRVPTRDGEVAVVDIGDPDAPPVVLLHGFPTSSFLWRRLIAPLAPFTRVIAPDLLGAGDSDAPSGADLGLSAQADRVGEVLEGIGVGSFAVVGHAHGGGIAQRLAVDGGVEALGLIDSIAFDEWPSWPVRDLQTILEGADDGLVDAWLRTGIDLAMSHRSRLPDAELEEYLRPYRGSEGARRFSEAARALDGAGLDGIAPRLAELDVPALVVWGEDDAFLDVHLAERLGDVLPRAAVAVLPGCGHLLLDDAPDTVAPLVFQWLRSQYLKVEHRHDTGPVVVSLERPPRAGEVG